MPTKKLNYQHPTGEASVRVLPFTEAQKKRLASICDDDLFAGELAGIAAKYSYDAQAESRSTPAEARATLDHFRARCADLYRDLWFLPAEASAALRSAMGDDFSMFATGLRAATNAEAPLAPARSGRRKRGAELLAALALRELFQRFSLRFSAAPSSGGESSGAAQCLQVVFDIARVRSSNMQPLRLAEETIAGYVKSALKVKTGPR